MENHQTAFLLGRAPEGEGVRTLLTLTQKTPGEIRQILGFLQVTDPSFDTFLTPLEEIHFTGQRLHLFVSQTTCVGENGQRIAGERHSGKNIKLNEIVAGGHVRKYLFV